MTFVEWTIFVPTFLLNYFRELTIKINNQKTEIKCFIDIKLIIQGSISKDNNNNNSNKISWLNNLISISQIWETKTHKLNFFLITDNTKCVSCRKFLLDFEKKICVKRLLWFSCKMFDCLYLYVCSSCTLSTAI